MPAANRDSLPAPQKGNGEAVAFNAVTVRSGAAVSALRCADSSINHEENIMDAFADMKDDLPFAVDPRPVAPTEITKQVLEELFWQACGRCSGRGYVAPWGTCFKCNGAKGRHLKTSPQQRTKSRQQAAARKENAKQTNLERFAAAHPAEYTWMNGNTFAFAQSMVVAIAEYGDLTPNQLAAVHRCITKRETVNAERAARLESAPEVSLAPVEAAFSTARASGIKWPKLNLDAFQLKPANATGNNAGAIYVTEAGQYLGKVMGGRFLRVRECSDEQQSRILAVAADPKAAAIAYGKRFGQCSVCSRELSNAESITRGIGPICAEKFGW